MGKGRQRHLLAGRPRRRSAINHRGQGPNPFPQIAPKTLPIFPLGRGGRTALALLYCRGACLVVSPCDGHISCPTIHTQPPAPSFAPSLSGRHKSCFARVSRDWSQVPCPRTGRGLAAAVRASAACACCAPSGPDPLWGALLPTGRRQGVSKGQGLPIPPLGGGEEHQGRSTNKTTSLRKVPPGVLRRFTPLDA